MCWFVNFRVVLQKDTPHARGQIAPVPVGCMTFTGTWPVFSMPKGPCGCGLVMPDGVGIVGEAVATLRHYMTQRPVKRVEVWWAWQSGREAPEPESEERLDWHAFAGRNERHELRPGVLYRLSEPAKWAR